LLTAAYAIITFALVAWALAFGTVYAVAIATLAIRAGTASLFLFGFFVEQHNGLHKIDF
jgi:hypothetical protein